jgi:hypothetical protein
MTFVGGAFALSPIASVLAVVLCVAVSLGALGTVLASHPLATGLGYLLPAAILYQLLGRLWSAAVWLELWEQG